MIITLMRHVWVQGRRKSERLIHPLIHAFIDDGVRLISLVSGPERWGRESMVQRICICCKETFVRKELIKD